MLLLTFAITLIVITSIVIISTPIRYYLPGYSDAEVKDIALKNAIIIDSLEQTVNSQTTYIRNVRAIFAGKLLSDSTQSRDVVNVPENDPSLQKSESEKDFSEQYEKHEKNNLSSQTQEVEALKNGISFNIPLEGKISTHFDATKRIFGVDIVAKPNERVAAVYDGTVIFAGFEANSGYLIQVQHKNGFVSIYSQNGKLLKQIGDKVRTGEAIALVANAGKEKRPVHLHLELWHNGSPVNPASYIPF